jgi:LmbE family N-acetylglucosaminyl deacetylase
MLDILVIAPHPDDAELGCGGAILRWKAEGKRVGVLDLTSGEPTPFGSLEIRAKETAAATEILGLDWRGNLGLPNRSLEHTLEARGKLAGVIRQQRPRWLLAPYWVDAHPDHLAATELIEAERVLHYSCVHLKVLLKPEFVLDISPHWEAKRRAIECFHSQFIEGRPTASPTFIDRLRDQAAYWGWSIGVQYGEPFMSREPIGLSSTRDLI